MATAPPPTESKVDTTAALKSAQAEYSPSTGPGVGLVTGGEYIAMRQAGYNVSSPGAVSAFRAAQTGPSGPVSGGSSPQPGGIQPAGAGPTGSGLNRADAQSQINRMPQADQLALGAKLADESGLPHISSLTYGEVMKGTWPMPADVKAVAFGKGVGAKEGGPYSFRLLTAEGALYSTPSGAFELIQMGQIKASGSAGSLPAILAQPGKYSQDVQNIGLVAMNKDTQAALKASGATPSTITATGGVYTYPVYSSDYQRFSIQAGAARNELEASAAAGTAAGWTAESIARYNTAAQAQADVYNKALAGKVIVPNPGGIAAGGGYLPGPGQVKTGYDVVQNRGIVQTGQLAAGETFSSPVLSGGYVAGIRPATVQAPSPGTSGGPTPIKAAPGATLTQIGPWVARPGPLTGEGKEQQMYAQIGGMPIGERVPYLASHPLEWLRYSELFMEKEVYTPARGGQTAEQFWSGAKVNVEASRLPEATKWMISRGADIGEYWETHSTGTVGTVLASWGLGEIAGAAELSLAAAPVGSTAARLAPFATGAYRIAQYGVVGAVAVGSGVSVATSPTPEKTGSQITAQLIPWGMPWYARNAPDFFSEIGSRTGFQVRQATPEEVARMGRVKQEVIPTLDVRPEIDLTNAVPENVRVSGEIPRLNPEEVTAVTEAQNTRLLVNIARTSGFSRIVGGQYYTGAERINIESGMGMFPEQAYIEPLTPTEAATPAVTAVSMARLSYPYVLAGGMTSVKQTVWMGTAMTPAAASAMVNLMKNDPIVGAIQAQNQAVSQTQRRDVAQAITPEIQFSQVNLAATTLAARTVVTQVAPEKSDTKMMAFMSEGQVPVQMPFQVPAQITVPLMTALPMTTTVPPPDISVPSIPWLPALPSFGGGGAGGFSMPGSRKFTVFGRWGLDRLTGYVPPELRGGKRPAKKKARRKKR